MLEGHDGTPASMLAYIGQLERQIDEITPPIAPPVARADGPEEVNELAAELARTMMTTGLLAWSREESTRKATEKVVAMILMEATDAAWWAATDDTRTKMARAYEAAQATRAGLLEDKVREALSYALPEVDVIALDEVGKTGMGRMQIGVALNSARTMTKILVEALDGKPVPTPRRIIPQDLIDHARSGDLVAIGDGVFEVEAHNFIEAKGERAAVPPPRSNAQLPGEAAPARTTPILPIDDFIAKMKRAGSSPTEITAAVKVRQDAMFVVTVFDHTHRWFFVTENEWSNDLDAAALFTVGTDADDAVTTMRARKGSWLAHKMDGERGYVVTVMTRFAARDAIRRDREVLE